eukprot:TRINITY_DN3124_c0_g1_i3.p1 TRINITY_DN3124_c0_g1~~TRINITY_DN3124_c0_g1_i3.p1  ORF type:complete len:331 (-),score=56.70 TRINITY_DN3124_c0_g1_i3:3-995(-)
MEAGLLIPLLAVPMIGVWFLWKRYTSLHPVKVKEGFSRSHEHLVLKLLIKELQSVYDSQVPNAIPKHKEIDLNLGMAGKVKDVQIEIGELGSFDKLYPQIETLLEFPHQESYKPPQVGDRVVVRNDYFGKVLQVDGKQLIIEREDNKQRVTENMGITVVPVILYEEKLHFKARLPEMKIILRLEGPLSYLGKTVQLDNFEFVGVLRTREKQISKEKRILTTSLVDSHIICRAKGNLLGRFVPPRVQRQLNGFKFQLITEPNMEFIEFMFKDQTLWKIKARKALSTRHTLRAVYNSHDTFWRKETALKIGRIFSKNYEVVVPFGDSKEKED